MRQPGNPSSTDQKTLFPCLEEAFGRVLRRHRLDKSLSQEQLGWDAQIDRKFISRLERGEREPGLRTIVKLTHAMGITLGEFMDEVEQELGLNRAE